MNSLLNINKGIDKIVDKLDIDAPLRTNQIIDPKDQLIDLENYAIIYKLLLGGKIQKQLIMPTIRGILPCIDISWWGSRLYRPRIGWD